MTTPRICSDITPGWLNDTLGDDLLQGAAVSGVGIEIIGEGVGFLGEVARLSLTYDRATDAPTSVIAKLPTNMEGPRFMADLLGFYEKEHQFYADVAPDLRVRVPRCYINIKDEAAEPAAYLLLLEDLAPMRPGDQLASCSAEEAGVALNELARLHARWWEHPRLDEFAAWLPGHGDPYFEIAKGAFTEAIDPFFELWGERIPTQIKQSLERDKVDMSDYELRAEATIGRSPRTFVHGDFRLDNMMFGSDESGVSVAIIDWQVGMQTNPMFDVVYFVAGNFSPEFRLEHEDSLLRGYHQGLVDGGVTDYSFEQCWEDYRAMALVLIPYAVLSAANIDLDEVNERGSELFEVMFDRYMKVVVDLDSFSLMS